MRKLGIRGHLLKNECVCPLWLCQSSASCTPLCDNCCSRGQERAGTLQGYTQTSLTSTGHTQHTEAHSLEPRIQDMSCEPTWPFWLRKSSASCTLLREVPRRFLPSSLKGENGTSPAACKPAPSEPAQNCTPTRNQDQARLRAQIANLPGACSGQRVPAGAASAWLQHSKCWLSAPA